MEFNPYRHIQTPFLTKIFADQDHKDEALNWMLALVIGRLMFEVNEVDQWQIFVNIVGVAGTGKSMLCNMIQKFFEQCDIGIINNNGQEKFMEGTLIHKRIVLGIEVDDKIDRALGRHSICAGVGRRDQRHHQGRKEHPDRPVQVPHPHGQQHAALQAG